MSYPRILDRDMNGRETLWQCATCGNPFTLGWGSQCNSCINTERRHKEVIAAIEARNNNLAPILPSDVPRGT